MDINVTLSPKERYLNVKILEDSRSYHNGEANIHRHQLKRWKDCITKPAKEECITLLKRHEEKVSEINGLIAKLGV